jgi:hypothetical protein
VGIGNRGATCSKHQTPSSHGMKDVMHEAHCSTGPEAVGPVAQT